MYLMSKNKISKYKSFARDHLYSTSIAQDWKIPPQEMYPLWFSHEQLEKVCVHLKHMNKIWTPVISPFTMLHLIIMYRCCWYSTSKFVCRTDKQLKQWQNSCKKCIYLPSSYKCPSTFTKAIKCKSTFSSKLGAYKSEQSKSWHVRIFICHWNSNKKAELRSNTMRILKLSEP